MSLGAFLTSRRFKTRVIEHYENYTLLMPVCNEKVNGLVVAFCPQNGTIQWTCEYTDDVAHGKYTHYDNGILTFTQEINYENELKNVALRCAEYVLASPLL